MDIKQPKISNNVFEVIQHSIQSIDSMVVFLLNSPSAQKETVSMIVDATKNIKKVINTISAAISDIVKTLAELEIENINAIIDAGSIFMISSIKMAINKNNGDQFKGPALIIASYAKLLSLVSELSQYAQNIDKRAIKKSSKATALIFNYLYKTYLKIFFKSKIFEKMKLPTMINIFFDSTNNVIRRITESLSLIGSIIQTFDSIGGKKAKKQIRKAIKTLFSIYIDTIVGSIQLGELLFTGNLTRSYLIPERFRIRGSFGVKKIIGGLIALIVLTKYFNIVFKMIPPIMGQLNYIGENSKNIKSGLKTLWIVLYGSHYKNKLLPGFNVPGLLDIMTHSKSLTASRIKRLGITFILLSAFAIFSVLLRPVITSLITIGTNKKNIILGLLMLEMMLVNKKKSKIKSLTYIFDKAGNKSNLKNIKNTIVLVSAMTLIMSLMFIIFSSLRFAGKNFRDIRRGIKAVSLILLGSKGFLGIGKKKSLIQILSSITKKDIKNITNSIKPIATLTLISVLLNVLTLNLAIIGRRYRMVKRGVKALRFINKLINVLSDIQENLKRQRFTNKKIWDLSKKLILITSMLTILAFELSLIGMSIVGIALSIPALLFMRIALIELMWLIRYINKQRGLKKSIPRLTSIGILIRLLTKTFLLFLAASLTLPAIAMATVGMLAVIGGMILVLTSLLLISLLPMSKISGTMIALLLAAGSVYLLAQTFIMISKSVEKMNFVAILAFMGVMVLFIGLFALIGLASPLLVLAVIGAASMVLIGVSLLLLIVPMMLLSMLDPKDFENAEANAKMLIKTSLNIIHSFVEASDEANGIKHKEGEGWMISALKSIGGTVISVIEAIFAFAFVTFTFLTVGMILLTAATITALNDINLSDVSKAEANVSIVFGVAEQVIAAVCKKPDTKKADTADAKEKQTWKDVIKGIGSSIGDIFKGIVNIAEALISFGYVAFIMITVGMITLVAKNLEYLEKVKVNRSTVLTSVGNVMETARLVAEKVDNSKITKDSVRNAERAKDLLRKLAHSTEWMAKIGKFNKSGEFNSAIDSYTNFVEKVNTVKIENLKTATNMFEKMAEFSQTINGNFEGLADVLNEKIVEYLQKINDALEKANEKLGAGENSGGENSGGGIISTAVDTAKAGLNRVKDKITGNSSSGNVNTIDNETLAKISQSLEEIVNVIDTSGSESRIRTIESYE